MENLADLLESELLSLAHKIHAARALGFKFGSSPTMYPWSDEHGHGVLQFSDIVVFRRDTIDDDLLFGPKMAPLLSASEASADPFHMVCGGSESPKDPRFVEDVDYGSVVFWGCEAQASITARSRFIKSKLANIHDQLQDAPLGIAHIGMDAERDNAAADSRHDKNRDTIKTFHVSSKLLEVELYYFLSRVTESTASMIDETVQPFTRLGLPFLRGTRVFGGSSAPP